MEERLGGKGKGMGEGEGVAGVRRGEFASMGLEAPSRPSHHGFPSAYHKKKDLERWQTDRQTDRPTDAST